MELDLSRAVTIGGNVFSLQLLQYELRICLDTLLSVFFVCAMAKYTKQQVYLPIGLQLNRSNTQETR